MAASFGRGLRVPSSDERLSLSLEGRANPFGERNLEEAANIPDFTVRFMYEAERLIRRGLRPEKPDLQRLLEEAARNALARAGLALDDGLAPELRAAAGALASDEDGEESWSRLLGRWHAAEREPQS